MQEGSGSHLKSCLRAWKDGGPLWCSPGEPWGLCQDLPWAGLYLPGAGAQSTPISARQAGQV